MENKNGGVTKKVEKTTQNLLTEQNPYNILTFAGKVTKNTRQTQ